MLDLRGKEVGIIELTSYLNGEFVPASEAKLSVYDRAVRYADAVFDTERTFNGKVLQLREHLERFSRSLHMVQIDPGLSLAEMEEITLEVVRRNEPLRGAYGDYFITQAASRGMGRFISETGPPSFWVRVDPIPF